jgi:hypothetical protein
MDSKQTKIIWGLVAAIVCVWLVSPLAGTSEKVAEMSPQFQPAFNAMRALNTVRDFATQFPQRVLGSIDSRQSTGYLQEALEKLGYTTSYTHFDARLEGHRQVGRNILGFKPGQSQEIIAVVAHYDTAATTSQGAMDNGSGVGVLLELARLFSQGGSRRSLLFVLSDGEEYGSLGILDFAQTYEERGRIVGVLSLDHVSIGDLAAIRLDDVGQIRGYTPPWLRRIARLAAQDEGLPAAEPWGLGELFERALAISWSDQGPFLREGIPAINLNSESKDQDLAGKIYHSAQDTIENLKAPSIEQYGRVAERILRTIDSLPEIPKESMGALRVREGAFLPSAAAAALQYFAFLPLLFVIAYYWNNHRHYLSAARIQQELVWWLATVLPFIIAYYLLILLSLLRLLPMYTLYPAAIKDPVLSNPSWRIINSLLGTYLFFAVGLFFLIRFIYRKKPHPDFHVSKLILLVLLLAVSLLALAYNSYWAVSFLALPAWIWTLVGIGDRPGACTVNRVWILAAGIPCYVMLLLFSSRMELGWDMVWYFILALTMGMFTQTGFLLAVAAIAIGIRFLMIQCYSRT